jgi:hypothetical protein
VGEDDGVEFSFEVLDGGDEVKGLGIVGWGGRKGKQWLSSPRYGSDGLWVLTIVVEITKPLKVGFPPLLCLLLHSLDEFSKRSNLSRVKLLKI